MSSRSFSPCSNCQSRKSPVRWPSAIACWPLEAHDRRLACLSAANVAILTHLCDLLCFFVSNHTFRSKYLILSTPTLAKAIGRLLRPKPRLTRHTHLRLAALRFLRACVARADEFYNRFLVKHDLIRPVLETAAEERDKDNLLGSACLEFFEHVRTVSCWCSLVLCALEGFADLDRGFVDVRQTSGRY